MAVLLSMLWAILFFHDNITINNVIGIVIIIIGTFIVNSDNREEAKAVDKIEVAEEKNKKEKVVDKK
jgi:drug/metabolite transporter (DMT)-like permease